MSESTDGMTGDSGAPEVFEEDREAVKEAVYDMFPEGPPLSSARLEELAREHARLGDWQFRLRYGFRVGRTPAERANLRFWLKLSSEEEREAEMAAYRQRPLDMTDLEVADLDVNRALHRYAQFQLDLIVLVVNWPGSPAIATQYRHLSYQIRELQHVSTLNRSRLNLLVRRLEEIRIRHRMGQAQAKDCRSASAFSLSMEVIDRLRRGWHDLHRDSGQRSRAWGPYSQTPAGLMHSHIVPMLPVADDLMAQWRAEFAAARLEFPPALPDDEANVHSSAPSKSAEEPSPVSFNESDYASWALGLRDDSRWALFRKVSGQWHWDRLLDIPKGNQSLLLQVLLEQRGSVDRRAFLERLRTQAPYQGEDVEKLSRVITDALSKIKNAIRKAIGDALKLADPVPGNPIPNDGTGWLSIMPLGIVEFGQDGRPRLKVDSYNVA